MKLTIVATMYCSAPHIVDFCTKMTVAAEKLTRDFEFILVNDGSPDNALEVALSERARDSRIKIIDLSRNFGHHKAMMTGLAYAKGEQVFLIDSDLEEDPEWLIEFAKQMHRDKCDVVYGVQESRKGGFFERWTGRCYYRIFKALTGLTLPANLVTARLMSRRYVEALLLHEEREIMIAGLWLITGFDQRPIVVNKLCRNATTYTIRHKMSAFVNSITSFSNAPLIGIFYIGTITFLVAGFYAAYLFIYRVFFARPISGWTSVMVSIWALGGLVISFMGIIGIYIAKVFSETKRRPYTIVRQIYGNNNEQ